MVARILEEEGIPTVMVMTYRDVAEIMRPPRSVYVHFPIGLTLGEPGNAAQQHVVIADALNQLQKAKKPGNLRVLPYRWRRENYERRLKKLEKERAAKKSQEL